MPKSGNIRRSNKDNTPDFWKRPKMKREQVAVSNKTYTLVTVKLKQK